MRIHEQREAQHGGGGGGDDVVRTTGNIQIRIQKFSEEYLDSDLFPINDLAHLCFTQYAITTFIVQGTQCVISHLSKKEMVIQGNIIYIFLRVKYLL